jgi:hypothetical protein
MLRMMREGGVVLLNVRPEDEYGFGHLPGALNIPLRQLAQRLAELPRDFHKPDLFQHLLPACARQASGNSGSPEVNVADRRFGNGLAVRDVGELEPTARAQHPQDFTEHGLFVDTQIDDAVAYYNVSPAGRDRHILDDALAEFDVGKTHTRRRRARLFQHLISHVDADYTPLGADLACGDEAVKAAAGADIDDMRAKWELAQ